MRSSSRSAIDPPSYGAQGNGSGCGSWLEYPFEAVLLLFSIRTLGFVPRNQHRAGAPKRWALPELRGRRHVGDAVGSTRDASRRLGQKGVKLLAPGGNVAGCQLRGVAATL